MRIPPFRIIKGRTKRYPTTKAEWVATCKRAIAFEKKRLASARAGRPTKRSYYYETLLTSAKQRKKRVLRGQHRTALRELGEVPATTRRGSRSNIEVHHDRGVYDLRHAVAMTKADHIRIHGQHPHGKRV